MSGTTISKQMKKTCRPTFDLPLSQPNVEIYDSNISDISIEALIYENKPMKFMPLQLGLKFPFIEMIRFINTSLKEVHKKEFKYLKHLIIINLKDNQLQELEKNLFEDNSKLELINLVENKIKFIHPKAFDNKNGLLPNLKIIYLKNNICISRNGQNRDFNEIFEDINKNCEKDVYKLEEQIEGFKNDQLLVTKNFTELSESWNRAKRESETAISTIQTFNSTLREIIQRLPNISVGLEQNQNVTLESKEEIKHELSNMSNIIISNQNDTSNMLNGKLEKLQESISSLTNLLPPINNNSDPQESSSSKQFYDFEVHTIFMVTSIGQVFLIIVILTVLLFKSKPRSLPNLPKESPYETINNLNKNESKMTILTDNQPNIEYELADYSRPHEDIYSDPDYVEVPLADCDGFNNMNQMSGYSEIGMRNETLGDYDVVGYKSEVEVHKSLENEEMPGKDFYLRN